MELALLIILTLSLILILHTYLLFPATMVICFGNRERKRPVFGPADDLPSVAVLIAAHNEERVIGEKIRSVFASGYPGHLITVYVGSDACTDQTAEIVEALQKEYSSLRLVRFANRVGKISVINHLQSLGEEEILVMTDANVIFEPATLFELVKFFRDRRVAVVAGNIVKRGNDAEGVAWQEKKYLSLENRLKLSESNGFDLVMGAEGGCYAIRNSLFSKVPLRFIVDDFFITLQVLARGFRVLFNEKALCYEDVPGDGPGEFRRKVRISSGNFQNLLFFRGLLLRFFSPLGFCFWSHKVLRWLTPFLLIVALAASLGLTRYDPRCWVLVAFQSAGLLMPVFDRLLGFRSNLLKTVSHFYLMNLALLSGFVKFTRGIRSSVWQPIRKNA